MLKYLSFLVSALLLTSCSSIDEQADKKPPIYQNYIAEHKLEALDKISSFRFHGWRSLDNHYLIISTSFNRPFLIQLNSYCAELRFANTIAINKSGSSLHAKFDSIQVARLDTRHPIREKCIIKSIYKLTKEQAKEIGKLGKEEKKVKE